MAAMMLSKRQAAQKLAAEVWQAAKDELKAAQEKEKRLREGVIVDVFGAARLKRAGTSRATLPDGSMIKVEIRRQTKVDADGIGAALKRLSAAVGAVKGKLLGERLVSWKPSASLAELEKLEPEQAKLFDGVITIELSSPSLEFAPPK